MTSGGPGDDGRPPAEDDVLVVAAMVLDGRGAVVYTTPGFEKLLGYTTQELLTLSAWQLWADAEVCADALAAARGGQPTGRRTVLRARNGLPVEVYARVLPLGPSPSSEAGARFLALISSDTSLPDVSVTPPADLSPGLASDEARRSLALLRAVSTGIEPSADAMGIARRLATLLVADFADLVAVDLAQAVLEGGDLPSIARFGEMRLSRVAAASRDGTWPLSLPGVGAATPVVPDSPWVHELQHGRSVLIEDREMVKASLGYDDDLVRAVLPDGASSGLGVPLYARGQLLGGVTLWRTQPGAPFGLEDTKLIEQIASRVALSLDNSRRFVREHRAAVALQNSLLPHAVTDTPAAETAGAYVPAAKGAGVSGDWFDVITLPSLRTAFVMGDVVGHGIYAAATMGRLRTAVQTLADMDLEPEELLTHLDDLVTRLAEQQAALDPGGSSVTEVLGATCLYGVYDPGTRQCVLASAGHPPPALVAPDGSTRFVDLAPGPTLGVGGMPFEPAEVELEPGSVLVFYTDGLIGFPTGDMGAGMERLQRWLSRHVRPDSALDDLGRRALADLLDAASLDDAAALLVRTRGIPEANTASWEFEADPAVVADARQKVVQQLSTWGLDELAFTTELVVSELVTNAVRYAGGPIGLRLVRNHVLVCEVSDPSGTQPRLRRAHRTDEGGRGLFLVAQLTDRWGSRYTHSGKTIWTEQRLDSFPP